DERRFADGATAESFAEDIANRNGPIIASSIFSEGYLDNNDISWRIDNNAQTIQYFISTQSDSEAYRSWHTIESVSETNQNSEDVRVLQIVATEYNNADKNRINENIGTAFESGKLTASYEITLIKEGDVLKID